MKTAHCQVQRPRDTCRRRGRLLVGPRRSSVAPISAGPAVERGAPCRGGRGQGLSITESAGGSTYPCKAPRRDRAGQEGRGGGGGAGAGWGQSARQRQGQGRGHRAAKHMGSGAPWGRAAPPPSGARAARCLLPFLSTPTSWSRPYPPPPLLLWGSAVTVAGKRALPHSSPPASSLPRHPFFLLLQLITAGWLGEEGKVAPAGLGGHLPLTREPPWGRRMAAVAAAAREEAVPGARAQSAAAAAESGSGPSRRTRTESSGSRLTT